jgi:pimeloyl-ACP methyl ester carboxylesterase
MTIECRCHGKEGKTVALLHGGPGAPGSLLPLAGVLKERFCVMEPFQRGSGSSPLTVETHVEDFHELVLSACHGKPVAVVGHSWGAMLGLVAASAYPEDVRSLVLVGCGTFDAQSRSMMAKVLEGRTNGDLREKAGALKREIGDRDERMKQYAALVAPLYSFDPEGSGEPLACDGRAFEETWNDMLRLQGEGVYPAAFSAIRCPVLMLHGSWDPHPGWMIRDSLLPHIPQLEYVEMEECGHTPWRERRVRDRFFSLLSDWLESRP